MYVHDMSCIYIVAVIHFHHLLCSTSDFRHKSYMFISLFSACPAGKYRSDNDVTCQQCPGNTEMDRVGAPLCECLDGYYRATSEQPSTRCTRESLKLKHVEMMCVCVFWPTYFSVSATYKFCGYIVSLTTYVP